MSKDTKRYFKTILQRDSVEMEYSSETDEVKVVIDKKLNMGASIGTDRFTLKRADIYPFKQMLEDMSAAIHEDET